MVYDDWRGVALDFWDSSTVASVSSNRLSATITASATDDSVVNTQGATAMTTSKYHVFAYRVNGYFFAGYKPTMQNQRYRQCVIPTKIGGQDHTKC